MATQDEAPENVEGHFRAWTAKSPPSIRGLALALVLAGCSRDRSALRAEDAVAPAASVAPTDASPVTSTATAPCDRARDAHSASSPDGKLVVYVSTDFTRNDSTVLGDTPHQELCIAREGQPPRILLAGHSAPEDGGPEATLADFDNLLLSPDQRTLYFTSAGWVTSSAAHAVELATGKERFLVDGAIEAVLEAGPYKGMLLANHFRLDDTYSIESPKYRGRMAMWSVLTPAGKTVRRLPEEGGARRKVLEGR